MSSTKYSMYSTIRKFLNVVLIIYFPICLWLLWPSFLSSTFVWLIFLGKFFLCWFFVVWFPNFFATHVGFGLDCCYYGCHGNTWPQYKSYKRCIDINCLGFLLTKCHLTMWLLKTTTIKQNFNVGFDYLLSCCFLYL